MNRQGQDRKILERLIRVSDQKKISARFSGEVVIEIGKFFLGRPYAAGTLETKEAEHLIVNLREHDCVTFVENVLAVAWLLKSGEKTFEAFQRVLKKIRYRQGRLQDFASRLHYFSDWIRDNQKKGILRDMTVDIGGRPLSKPMTFMTTHPGLYPPLRDEANLRRMKSIERTISKRPLFYIPKRALGHAEERIHDGDIIAVTTHTEGLDVQHVGLAARVKNRIHLLHASSTEGKVVLSRQTLYSYLMQGRTRSGIMVARLES